MKHNYLNIWFKNSDQSLQRWNTYIKQNNVMSEILVYNFNLVRILEFEAYYVL